MKVEMRDSGINWIGEIPKHWEVKRFKNFIELINTPSCSLNKIALENIEGETGRFIPSESKFEGNGIQFSVDNIVYGKLRPYLQKVWLATFEGNAVGDFFVFKTQNGSIPKYVKWLMLSDGFTKMVDSSTYGAKMPRVASDFILNLPFYLPSVEEQSRIANFLDKKCAEIDELIALQEQMIAQLNTYKQAVITETVTKGLDPNVKMKDSGVEWIGEIPEHWCICRIKNLCREEQYAIKTGPFGTQLKGDDLKEEGDVCVYNQRNVIDADFNKVHSYVLIEKANSLKSFFTKPNDLLITTRGTIGRTAVLTKDYPMGILHPCLIALRIKQEISLNWLRYFFQTECFKTDILLSSNATTIEVIYTDNLKKVSLPFPPFSEQQSIAQYLDQKCKEIDELISIKKEKIEHLKAYKKSVIYEYVTGKKQVFDN